MVKEISSEKYLTVKELADKADVHVNLIYYYVQKGLLPQPERLPRKKVKGQPNGGLLSVYKISFLDTVKSIRQRTQEGKSLVDVKKEFRPSEEKRKESIIDLLDNLTSMAADGKYEDDKFKDTIKLISDLADSPTLAPGVRIFKKSEKK